MVVSLEKIRMNIIKYPNQTEWAALLERPHRDASELRETVQTVLEQIRQGGDAAVKEFELKFDKVKLDSLVVTEVELDEAEKLVSEELKDALKLAHANIEKFHAAQKFVGEKVESAPGVVCWQKSVPIETVGLYIPGGTAPLFSTVLMLATPAKIAGCQEIVLCTPPNKEGKVHPAILMAAKVAGVSKIFGPGNQFVMAAKQQVSLHEVAIDMPAGPSEVAVVADDTANPVFVAADLLSQAEHGVDSQSILITTSESMAEKVNAEVERQLALLPRKEMTEKSLQYSKIVVVRNLEDALKMTNEYAPEHLILAVEDYLSFGDRVVNAGSVFLGNYSCESAGDYASGTNHTLPTSGYAKAYSGVNLDSFCRKITFQELSAEGVRSIGRAVELMAEAEQLDAHKNAMTFRIQSL